MTYFLNQENIQRHLLYVISKKNSSQHIPDVWKILCTVVNCKDIYKCNQYSKNKFLQRFEPRSDRYLNNNIMYLKLNELLSKNSKMQFK